MNTLRPDRYLQQAGPDTLLPLHAQARLPNACKNGATSLISHSGLGTSKEHCGMLSFHQATAHPALRPFVRTDV